MRKNESGNMAIINLEEGMPTADLAKKKMIAGLEKIKKQGGGPVKIIHGYGSSGQGGAIRLAIQKSLALRRESGWIKAYVPGEKWEIFNDEARRIIDLAPGIRQDKDLGRSNLGVSIIFL